MLSANLDDLGLIPGFHKAEDDEVMTSTCLLTYTHRM